MILETIAGAAFKAITGSLGDKLLELYKLRQDGKITQAEYDRDVAIAKEDTQVKLQETAAKMLESVQQTIRSSPVIQRAYAVVMFMQLFILVWYQFGVSAFKLATGVEWPAPVASIEWAYLLIAAMIGVGPLVYKK